MDYRDFCRLGEMACVTLMTSRTCDECLYCDKDAYIAALRTRLEEAEREGDELRESKDFWYKSWILEENMLKEAEKIMVRQDKQLARYREGFRPTKEAWDKCKNYKSEDVVFKATEYEEAIEQAIKAVEGDQGSEAGK